MKRLSFIVLGWSSGTEQDALSELEKVFDIKGIAIFLCATKIN